MLACQQHMLQELTEQGLIDSSSNHVMRLQPHLVDMTVHRSEDRQGAERDRSQRR